MPRVSGTDTTPPREEDFIYASQEDSGELGRQEEISEDSGYRLVPELEKTGNLTIGLLSALEKKLINLELNNGMLLLGEGFSNIRRRSGVMINALDSN